MRLDVFLTKNNICESRNKSLSLIRDGRVKVNGVIVKKPSFDINDDDALDVDCSFVQYVARSANKLLTAISQFSLTLDGKIAVDLGSSTGGFCQVLLQHNAKRVYAVDIGTNQLHEKVRCDQRIVVRENTNARYLSPSDFDCDIDIITCDLSFISLKHILKPAFDVLIDGGEMVCLVKPQFEVGPKYIGKNGVVKDKKAQIMSINDVVAFASDVGFSIYGVSFSGLEGESGNREFLLYMKKDNCNFKVDLQQIKNTVIGVN